MPLSKHYGGHGEEVAENMKKEYGEDWKRVFYATENAKKKRHIDTMIQKGKKKS